MHITGKHSYTANELMALEGEKSRLLEDGRKWGIWTFQESNLTLEAPNDISDQQVDLEEMNSGFAMLRRMAQLRTKYWANSEVLGDLFSAFDDIFDLQKTLRSGDNEFDASALLMKRLAESKSSPIVD